MERVGTLLQKLNQQFNEGADPSRLLLTVQMLQHELLHLEAHLGDQLSASQVSMPVASVIALAENMHQPEPAPEEEKIVEVLQVDEAEVEAELEEIKKKAEAVERMSLQSRVQPVFEMQSGEVPTLACQQPVQQSKPAKKEYKTEKSRQPAEQVIVFDHAVTVEPHRIVRDHTTSPVAASVNDALKQERLELTDRYNEAPIKDLKKAIGINDRFVYISELFRGDETMYERSIKTINGFSIWPEAEYWIRRELKVKLGWQDDQEIVKQFDQLVKRRFS